jgi:L,D-transpeptidase catalytic domain
MKTATIMPLIGIPFFLTMCGPVREQHKHLLDLHRRAQEIKIYAQKNGFSTRYCFLLDMRISSGLKRFFVYDLKQDVIAFSGLVAHGSCDQNFLQVARFSNTPGGGCTSVGIYKVGGAYYGQYGKAYKLYGLENSNSNAFNRSVVLHGYTCVPDEETYPKPICNSAGCPMVSLAFLKQLSSVIDNSGKPVLLSIYDSPASQLAGNRRTR